MPSQRVNWRVDYSSPYGVSFYTGLDPLIREGWPMPRTNDDVLPVTSSALGKPRLASLIVGIMKRHIFHLKWTKFANGFVEAFWNDVPTFNPSSEVITLIEPGRYDWQEYVYTHQYSNDQREWTVTLTIDYHHELNNADIVLLRNPRIT